MKIEIVEATIAHAEDLAPRLRKSDKREVFASGGLSPVAALTMSVNASEVSWTALLDDVPHIMWGAAAFPDAPEHGCVWLLSSDEMYRIPGRFIEESIQYVSIMLDRFDTLSNYVHVMNIRSQQWLENLGFKALKRSENHNDRGEVFILYSRSA